MKQFYVAISLLMLCGFMYRIFNLETIKDLGMLIAWGIGLIIYHIESKFEK